MGHRPGPRPGPQEIPLAAAPPQRESRRRPALPVARSPPLQPQDRPCLPSEGSLSATVGIQFARLGRQVPRRVVPPDHAIPHRTHEEDRPFATQASRTQDYRVLTNLTTTPPSLLFVRFHPELRSFNR